MANRISVREYFDVTRSTGTRFYTYGIVIGGCVTNFITSVGHTNPWILTGAAASGFFITPLVARYDYKNFENHQIAHVDGNYFKKITELMVRSLTTFGVAEGSMLDLSWKYAAHNLPSHFDAFNPATWKSAAIALITVEVGERAIRRANDLYNMAHDFSLHRR